jgi:hypothetical protein
MEAVSSSETFMNFYQITRRHIPEASTSDSHLCETLKSSQKNKLSGPQSRSGFCGKDKNILALPLIEPRFFSHPDHSP